MKMLELKTKKIESEWTQWNKGWTGKCTNKLSRFKQK